MRATGYRLSHPLWAVPVLLFLFVSFVVPLGSCADAPDSRASATAG